MHAFLIINSQATNSKPKIDEICKKENVVKQLSITLQKIEDCRELKKITKYSFPEKTAIIINNIDTATTETANSFLKNLEEPNKNLIYILTANINENVLPTIASRCQIIKIRNSKFEILNKSDVEKFLDLNIDQKFEYVSKIKDRGKAIEFTENIIKIEHINDNYKNQQNYLNTLKNLKKNGNVSLQLTNLLVTSF